MADQGKIEVASLRSLDDFLLESARFQIPTFSDMEKWNNRVVQNLLYYQTNYFLTYIIIFILMSVIHPAQMFFGMVAIGLGFGIFFYLTNNKQVANDFKKSHPVVSVIFVLSSSYFVVYLLGSVVVFIFGILLPIFGAVFHVILIHASMRLRNMKNKIMNKVEWIGLRRSPMGIFLDFLGMEQEFVM
ncbi:PRA1 family protein 3 [Armadillidium nasatum]|uniref:PRA1 family protein n=2 Tax=Armadillidium nasatum TaxID=96803 RepID=A0A5N5TLC9_9CRUS|nr:PRA1 family protein 3 [Armadillidium nasatum]